MRSSAAICDPQTLGRSVRQVLEGFAYLSCDPYEGPAPAYDLSVHAPLPGGKRHLVLRGSGDLGRLLAESSSGAEPDELAEDAFVELCNIQVSHICEALSLTRGAQWKAFVPRLGLPQGKTEVGIVLSVEGHPLEVSVWSAA